MKSQNQPAGSPKTLRSQQRGKSLLSAKKYARQLRAFGLRYKIVWGASRSSQDGSGKSRGVMMDTVTATAEHPRTETAAWQQIVAEYQKPSLARALWQLANTLIPYALLWYLMYLSLAVSWWLVAPLAVLAGMFLVRAFIIFHDCGHGSYFKSRRANDVVGFLTGLLTFTPFYQWRWAHAIHHATSGHLDKRGTGDLWTLTVQEYLESSRWKRFAYRLARNPVFLFVIAPLFVLAVKQRFPSPNSSQRERDSVHWMNLAIFGMAVGLSLVFGVLPYLLIQLLVLGVADRKSVV